MSRSVRAWPCSLAVAIVVLAGVPGARAACVGDCDGSGEVGINELITGVRISLGEVVLAQCTAFDANPDGVLRIDELVRGVSDALEGCSPDATQTPAPTDAATPSATSADSPTETPTPGATGTVTTAPTGTATVPPVAGVWIEAPLEVGESTCPEPLTEDFAADLASRPPCEQTVEALSDSTVAVEDCTTTRIEGTLARDGTIRVAYPATSSTTGDCTVELTATAVIPAATSPTIASYTFAVGFSEECGLENCTIEAQGSWTRQE